MIPISNELNESLSDDNQIVRPNVKAWMSDLRSLDNLKVHSSSHTYEKQILDRNPQLYVKFDKTDYNSSKKVRDCMFIWNGSTAATTIQLNNHGLSDGDEIVFTTELNRGMPTNIKSGELHYANRYYVEVTFASYFYIHATRASAIAKTAGGRIVGGTLTSSYRRAISSFTVGPNATFTTASAHGYVDGDAIIFDTSGTIPGGISARTNDVLPVYYVQNATSTTFMVNTSYFNAISGLTEGIVETTSAGSGTVTVYPRHSGETNFEGGNRMKDYGDQAFDIAIGTSDAGVPIHDQTATSYHYTFNNHIEILEPNRLIDTFNKSSILEYYLNSTTSPGNPTVFPNVGYHSAGTPVMLDEISTLSGINNTTLYYIQNPNPSTGTGNLNTDYYNALNNISTGRVATTGTTDNISIIVYDTPKPGFFTKTGSTDTSSSDMSYYSWDYSDPKWTCFGDKLQYLSGIFDDNQYYVSTFVNSLDHFVDFKVDNGRGRNIYTRFIDEDNCVVLSYASPSFGYPIQITAYIDGNPTTVALIDPLVLSAFNPNHYYRFEAKYNVYSLYAVGGVSGTTEPNNGTTGTLIGQGYFDHPKLRTDEAKRCGLGFGNQITLNPMANSNTLLCQYDYFAAYGYNSLSNLYYFDYDNTTSAKKKYLYSSTALSSAKTSQFQALNNASDFTYSFYLYKQSGTNQKYTIFWLGNGAQQTALRISYVEATNDYLNVLINSSTNSYELNSTTLLNSTLYHIAVVKNSTRLSIYVNGVEVAYRTDIPSNFVLKDVITGQTPYIMFGGDYAGTTLGDPSGYHLLANTYLSEFAVFDYALSQADLNAMYYSVYNGATLAAQTVDDYFNAQCIIDGQLEETLCFAFTNMLNSSGSEIKANNLSYAPSPLVNSTNTTDIEENYGWMSRVQSGSNKLFSNPDFVELTFDSAKCNKIFVSTGYFNGRVASFNYVVTKSDGTTISGTKSFAGESIVFISSSDLGLQFDEYLNIISVKITPTATVNAYDYARLYTVNPIWEVDLSDYVISFSLDKIRDNYDASLPIGATAANNGSIIFDNSERIFNIFGDTLYGKYTTPDVPFFMSFDHELALYQTTEEIILATEMYADTWSFDNSSMTTEVSLRDYSKYIQEKTVDGYVSQGISAGRAIMDLMLLSGFPRRKIIFIDKYDETIFNDDPQVYVPFNDTAESILSSGTAFDHCQNATFSFGGNSLTLGKSLLYSDTISVQDESERKNIGNVESTFEPYYRQGSVKSYCASYENLFGYSNSSWTTEFFHYVDIDNFTNFNVKTILASTYSGSSTPNPENYRLYYEVSGSSVVYTWSFFSTSNQEYEITSASLDAAVPHQIVVRKTGGSPNTYDLIIDGVIEDTMSPSVSIKNAGNGIKFFNSLTPSTFISNYSFYNKSLSLQSIINHYISASVSLVSTYRYLYAADETYWDAMLSIATADLGMFYIDEYGDFRYEYRNFIHEDIFQRYQNSQYTFADNTNIISGNYTNEIQTNKISVSVKKVSIESTSTAQLWSAADGESLVTGTLAAAMSPQSTSVILGSTTDPYWLPIGYVKIDDEIIKYNNINGNILGGLERGYFGTSASWHATGSLAREAKYFTVGYSSKPAASVKYPLLTNTFVEIDRFSATASAAEVIISVKSDAPKNSIFVISGTNTLTKLKYVFSIAGVAVSNSSSEEVLTDMASEITSNIRRYGVKELKIDNPFIQNKPYAQIVADYVLGYYKEPVRVLEMEVLAVPHLQLGDLITIGQFEDLGIVDREYWITSISINYDGGIKQSLSLRAYGDTIDPPEFTFGSTSVPYTNLPSGGGEFFPTI